ncbi:MAG: hypothetical protein MJY71_00285 [Bacteroidaceae bacterium]|nr:hypothetical protein [Bacteroidaceae bacterium]
MLNQNLIDAFNAVHNVRSPLSIVLSRINIVISMLPEDSPERQKLEKCLPSIDRMNELISGAMASIKQNLTQEDMEHLI